MEFALRDLGKALNAAAADHPGLASIRRRTAELGGRLASLLEHGDEESTASLRWAQSTRYGVSFHYVPVDVAEQLGGLIRSHASAWVCTSATLAVGEDFGHFSRRVGIEDPTTVRFGSPFDFARQALLYLPQGLDAPASPQHTRQVVEAALPVLHASGRARVSVVHQPSRIA